MKETKEHKNLAKLHFFGGVGEVTGSNYMLEANIGNKTTRLLVDCGLFQGVKVAEEKNNENFPYDPETIDAVVVTHAHLDHIGRIPKLVKQGFGGKIYSTAPTKDFARLMLLDSLGVLEKEAKRNGKTEPIYSENDIKLAMNQWEAKNYKEIFSIGGLNICFKDAGHILGSAIIEVSIAEAAKPKKLVFSGDLGNSPEPLLNPTEFTQDANFMVIESTYGNRFHENYSESYLKLERIIEETVKNKGVLMIPAFSLERTQRLLFHINELVENGRIPKIQIYLDSPLSISATGVYRNYINLYNNEARNEILSGDDLFNFPGLKLTLSTDESKAISKVASPKVIIAGAGMCNGGRILHHLKNYLPRKNNTLLLVSYQAAGSLGRLLEEGARLVKIMGEDVIVDAKIEKIGGYSSHADLNGLLTFVGKSSDYLEKVFVSHGEPKSSLFFVQRIKDYLGIDAVAPETGDIFEIEI